MDHLSIREEVQWLVCPIGLQAQGERSMIEGHNVVGRLLAVHALELRENRLAEDRFLRNDLYFICDHVQPMTRCREWSAPTVQNWPAVEFAFIKQTLAGCGQWSPGPNCLWSEA